MYHVPSIKLELKIVFHLKVQRVTAHYFIPSDITVMMFPSVNVRFIW